MRSSLSRPFVGSFRFSTRRARRGALSSRAALRPWRSLWLSATLVAGALLVVPTRRVWAAPAFGDENGPQVQIFSPGYQSVLKGTTSIVVGVTARQYNPATIELWVDDRQVTGALPLSALASMKFDWDTRRFTDGPHKLSVRSTDAGGFRGVREVNVYINNSNKRNTVAPELRWKNVVPFQQLSGNTQLELESPSPFGAKLIMVKLAPTDPNNTTPLRSWVMGGGERMVKFDTTKVSDGLYSLNATLWDALDQQSNAPSLTIGVVNSPINATTISESLDVLRAKAESEKSTTTRTSGMKIGEVGAIKPPKPITDPAIDTLPKVPVVPSDVSGPTGLTPRITKPLVPQKPLPPAPVFHVTPPIKSPVHPPRIISPYIVPGTGASGQTKGYGTGNTSASNGKALKVPKVTTTTSATKIKRIDGDKRIVDATGSPELQTSPTLSPLDKAQVLSPAFSENATQEAPASPKTFVARVEAPEVEAGVDEPAARLSTESKATTDGALSPARAPLADKSGKDRIEVARLSLPEEQSHGLEVAPVFSASKAFDVAPSPVAKAVDAPSTTRVARPLVASAPVEVAERAVPRTRRVTISNVGPSVHETRRHEVKHIETPRVNTVPKVPVEVAQNVETAPVEAPQLSASHHAPETVVTTRTPIPSPHSKIVPRIAMSPDFKRGSARVESMGSDAHPAITVSPVQTAYDTPLPKSHLVKRETTLRALAEHYGLPVEMVAAANNWNANMRVIPGMVVLLPRQVKVSYNGQKVEGDVSSMLIGDTTVTAMRFLFEQNGGKLSWDAAHQEVIATKGSSTIRIKIGSKVASVNNKKVMMQLAAFLFEGRTMVPARFFEEGFNAQVEWNPETGHIVVAMVG